MRVLLVTTSLRLDPLPAGFRSVDAVQSLDAAVEVASRYDGVIVDLREVADLPSSLAEAARRVDPLPMVAVVRGATDGAGTERVRLVEDAWLSRGYDVLAELLRRDVVSAACHRELLLLRDRQAQIVHNEKFAAVGLLAAEIAHEINNPATFVITNLTVMMDYVDTIGTFHDELRARYSAGEQLDLREFEALQERHEIGFLGEDLHSLLVRSLNGLNRIHQIVQDLRYFGADRSGSSSWVDLNPLVHAALGLVRHEARFRAQLVVELPRLPPLRSDANRLSQVILNVLVNAMQSIEPGAPADNRVEIRATVSDTEVVLSVTDTGAGIPPQVLERVFEPFYTTKAPGEGTGLGLAISLDIMRSLGGDIRALSVVGEGSTFEIVIPRGDDD